MFVLTEERISDSVMLMLTDRVSCRWRDVQLVRERYLTSLSDVDTGKDV